MSAQAPLPGDRDVPFLPPGPDMPSPSILARRLREESGGGEDWVEERGRLLNLLAQQQRLAQAGLLTAGLAHEVANHVMVITGLAYAAQRSIDPTAWRESLEQIQDRCEDVSATMQTILAFADRRAKGLRTTFHASDIVAQTVRLLRPLALKMGISLFHRVHEDARMAGDERLVVQALVNLGSNAIRACGAGPGRVSIRVTGGPHGTCRLTVEDDGPGIPESLRPGIFRPFVTSQTDTNGHGLGLFIVRRAVVKLGGSIRVETSSEGTLFHIDLPIASEG